MADGGGGGGSPEMVFKNYFSRHSDLRAYAGVKTKFLGLTSVWRSVFMPA